MLGLEKIKPPKLGMASVSVVWSSQLRHPKAKAQMIIVIDISITTTTIGTGAHIAPIQEHELTKNVATYSSYVCL